MLQRQLQPDHLINTHKESTPASKGEDCPNPLNTFPTLVFPIARPRKPKRRHGSITNHDGARSGPITSASLVPFASVARNKAGSRRQPTFTTRSSEPIARTLTISATSRRLARLATPPFTTNVEANRNERDIKNFVVHTLWITYLRRFFVEHWRREHSRNWFPLRHIGDTYGQYDHS